MATTYTLTTTSSATTTSTTATPLTSTTSTTVTKSSRENIVDALKRVVQKIEDKIEDSSRKIRAGSQSCSWFDERLKDLLAIIRVVDQDNITEEQEKALLEIELDILNTNIGPCNSAQKEKLIEDKQEFEDIICKLENKTACSPITSTTTKTSTTSTSSTTTTATTTEKPAPELLDMGTKTKIAYMEDGEIFEQQDNFNNISGEAIVEVPPHGNLTELSVILQPSTVSKYY